MPTGSVVVPLSLAVSNKLAILPHNFVRASFYFPQRHVMLRLTLFERNFKVRGRRIHYVRERGSRDKGKEHHRSL